MLLKEIYHYFVIKRSGLFDVAYYLLTYSDVQLAGINPIWHYIKFGWKEKRNPSANFNTAYYISQNRDVQALGVNPLIHFIQHGRYELRSTNPESTNGDYLYYNNSGKQKTSHAVSFHSNQPVVSIVIPVFNALEYTQACIQSIFEHPIEQNFEVIIVDNGSKKPTTDWLKSTQGKFYNLTCIFLKNNLGFSPAVNIGINQSRGEYVVILNNDTITTSGWLDKLYLAFQNDLELGIVSPVTNYVGEGIQIDYEACNIQRHEVDSYARGIAKRDAIKYDPSRLVFFCVMIRRSVLDLTGLLDEGYVRGNFEDDDYCLRARLLGYKLGVVTNSFVYHHGSITFKEHNFNYSEHFENNRIKFFQKAGRLATNKPLLSRKILSQKEKVSIIVRTVNRPELLILALNSLANQTRKPDEVVIVNDGGPDIQEMFNSYTGLINIQYIKHKSSQGRTAALNAGIASSTGNWLAILDDDDIYYPWHIETMLNAANNNSETQFFYGCYNRVLIDSEISNNPITIIAQSPFDFSRNVLLVGNMIPINSWFFSKAIFEDLGGVDETFNTLEDYDFLLKVSEKYPLKLVNKTICEYRFYLSQANSIVRLRADALIALQRIYDRYPVTNNKMKLKRKQAIYQLRNQCQLIEQLQRKLEACPEDKKKEIYIEMLNIAGAIN